MTVAMNQAGLPLFKKVAVIGFGLTGQSVMRFFSDSTAELIAMDTRDYPPNKQELQALFPNARLVTGGLDQHTLRTADLVVVSPGVGADQLNLANLVGTQTKVLGDIQLFADYAVAPILAITGSNGKSTVATLVDLMINASGKTSLLGGNIGIPALDLFKQSDPDFYVLELSSFQLDTTDVLNAEVAAVLNVSEDHLDRYASFSDYAKSKSTIYRGTKYEVVNRDDQTAPGIYGSNTQSFGLNQPSNDVDFGLLENGSTTWIVKGETKLIDVSNLKLKGRQNWANVMATLAIVDRTGVKLSANVIDAACQFVGLPHRCEVVASINDILWINDSKGTNVGATIAAISGISEPKVLILGGRGKGADFSALRISIDESVRSVILLGEDAALIEAAFEGLIDCHRALDVESAVSLAANLAVSGDVVLFSPACASLDMFANFMARGDAFKAAVHAIQKDSQK